MLKKIHSMPVKEHIDLNSDDNEIIIPNNSESGTDEYENEEYPEVFFEILNQAIIQKKHI